MAIADRLAAASTVSPADLEGGAPELDVARDLAKRALPVAAVLLAVSAIGWQLHGVLTTGFAVAIVVLNFLAAAALMSWAARISLGMLMGAVLGGYLVRMGVVALAVFAVKDDSWVVLPLLGFSLVLTHLGLLFWETRHLSVSLAFPGLKPAPPPSDSRHDAPNEEAPLVLIVGIDFPPISHVIEWPGIFLKDTIFEVNKVVLLMWASAILVFAFYFFASRARQLVPTGIQNLGESAVQFIREGIILQTMGAEGLYWTPFLLMLFSFIFVCNIWEIIPFIQMPVNARIALPLFMALLVWFIFNFIGIKKQGFFGYFKSMLFPPGVPKALYILVTPIELVSTLFVRPLSLSVRLFANMLAGHLLLVSFAVITAALWSLSVLIVIWPVSFALLVGLTGFEVLVAVLQAFIFTILTAVYIGGAMHPEH